MASLWDPSLEPHRAEARQVGAEIVRIRRELAAGVDEIDDRFERAAAQRRVGEELRGVMVAEVPDGARVTDRTAPSPEGHEVPVRVYEPAGEPRGVYCYIHGGSWITGSPAQDDHQCWRYVVDNQIVLVSIDYRLAPEHPFPAGPDDCVVGARWTIDLADELDLGDRMAIGGWSAGAHLAVLALLQLRGEGLAGRYRAADLVFGPYDLAGTPSQLVSLAEFDLLEPGSIRWARRCVAPNATTEDDLRSPALSPLYADLQGLPPALFTVGANDHLLDDSILMHSRWVMAGNHAALKVYPDSVHGFVGFPTAMGAAARSRIDDFLQRHAWGSVDSS